MGNIAQQQILAQLKKGQGETNERLDDVRRLLAELIAALGARA